VDREPAAQRLELGRVLLLVEDHHLDLRVPLQHGHQGLEVAGAVAEVGLVVVLGDDDRGAPLLQIAARLALRRDDVDLKAEPLVQRNEVRVTAELDDGEQPRRGSGHVRRTRPRSWRCT
jgi:hypothetical protein